MADPVLCSRELPGELEETVSAVVCTHNRSDDAIECIETLFRDQPSASIPVVLVDSASDGEHAAALSTFAARHDSVRLERSGKPGLSIARNLAANVAVTPWLAFLDDDARPLPMWCSTAVEIARQTPDDVAVVGGRILPRWPGDRPAHVGKRWLMFLSCIEELEQDSSKPVPECYGANLMVRKSALEEVGGFPVELGRVGDVLLSGEENHFQHLLVQAGMKVRYDARLVVEHKIEPERLTTAWIKRRAFWGGVSEVMGARITGSRPPHLHPAKAALATILLRASSRFGDPAADRLIRAHYASGVLAGWRQPKIPSQSA